MKIIRKGKHLEDCWSVNNTNSEFWPNCWGVIDMEFANRFANKTPKRIGYVSWLRVSCNCPGCKAGFWVLLDDFLELLPKQ